jgi:hypothetical protein
MMCCELQGCGEQDNYRVKTSPVSAWFRIFVPGVGFFLGSDVSSQELDARG